MSSSAHRVRSGWILAAVSTALFCVQIDYFAMNLALPRMASDLGSTTTDLQWVISVYFAWAGPVVGQGTRAGFESALWICAAIGVAALATSIILKPRPLAVGPAAVARLAN